MCVARVLAQQKSITASRRKCSGSSNSSNSSSTSVLLGVSAFARLPPTTRFVGWCRRCFDLCRSRDRGQEWRASLLSGWGPFEFVDMCNALGIEPVVTTSAQDGQCCAPSDMADLVEYCHGNASTTWGAIRIADGHPEPYDVKVRDGEERAAACLCSSPLAVLARARSSGCCCGLACWSFPIAAQLQTTTLYTCTYSCACKIINHASQSKQAVSLSRVRLDRQIIELGNGACVPALATTSAASSPCKTSRTVASWRSFFVL
jgi:hypothetical protein